MGNSNSNSTMQQMSATVPEQSRLEFEQLRRELELEQQKIELKQQIKLKELEQSFKHQTQLEQLILKQQIQQQVQLEYLRSEQQIQLKHLGLEPGQCLFQIPIMSQAPRLKLEEIPYLLVPYGYKKEKMYEWRNLRMLLYINDRVHKELNKKEHEPIFDILDRRDWESGGLFRFALRDLDRYLSCLSCPIRAYEEARVLLLDISKLFIDYCLLINEASFKIKKIQSTLAMFLSAIPGPINHRPTDENNTIFNKAHSRIKKIASDYEKICKTIIDLNPYIIWEERDPSLKKMVENFLEF
jgi:hypothetical protein